MIKCPKCSMEVLNSGHVCNPFGVNPLVEDIINTYPVPVFVRGIIETKKGYTTVIQDGEGVVHIMENYYPSVGVGCRLR